MEISEETWYDLTVLARLRHPNSDEGDPVAEQLIDQQRCEALRGLCSGLVRHFALMTCRSRRMAAKDHACEEKQREERSPAMRQPAVAVCTLTARTDGGPRG